MHAPAGRAPVPAGPVLPAAELRNARRRRRRDAHADGGARAHRRVGRSRAGAGLDHRPRDGRLVGPVRRAAARASRSSSWDPTGTPTDIEPNETVLLVGGGLGNAVLFSIGQAFRAAGSQVLYFAGYKKIIDRYKVEEIEAAADVVVWCCDEAPGFAPGPAAGPDLRRQHRSGDARPTAPAALARSRSRSTHADADHRHRLRPHDGGGRARAARGARAVPEGRATSRSARSTRRCSA